jgi:opacity protein-like surface antigen
MNRIVRAAFAAVAITLAVSATEAQAQIGFSIGGGPSFALGDFGDNVDMGYHAKVGAHFSLPMLPIGLVAEGMWSRWDHESLDDTNATILNGALNAVINIPTPGFSPYLIGGVGYYNLKQSMPTGDVDFNDFGINIGAGVKLGLPGLSVFGEARLHNVMTEGESTRFIPVSLGVRF